MLRFSENSIGLAMILMLGTAAIAGVTPSVSQHKPAFEVASVKRRSPTNSDFRSSFLLRGNRFNGMNFTLKRLVEVAYGSPFRELLSVQIIGGPQWIAIDGFDVEATVDNSSGSVPLEEVLLMLRSLLEDRFQLRVHRETRELQVYYLVVAKQERLRLSKDQTRRDVNDLLTAQAADPGTLPRGVLTVSRDASGQVLVGNSIPMSQLAGVMEIYLRRPVVDKTNLDALFDIRLALWRGNDPSAQETLNVAPTASDPSSNTRMFAGIQDELGLCLDSTKAPVEVIVIDHVQLPSVN
jgi:uncharacterized protein (TIGR03435 family)